MSRGHKDDRNYVITHNWLGVWEGSCPMCGTETEGSLATVFALLWRHRKCAGPVEQPPTQEKR